MHMPHFLPFENFTQFFFEDPKNDKKEIENFGTSKYQNKRPLKFLENQILYLPLMKLHMKKLKIPKMTRRKI
jgi:hypothetical protein